MHINDFYYPPEDYFPPADADSKWLLSVYETNATSYTDFAHIYRRGDGEIMVKQRFIYGKNGNDLTLHTTPRFTPERNPLTCRYHVWYNSFRHTKDPDGAILQVQLLRMNGALTRRALASPVMRPFYAGADACMELERNGFLLPDAFDEEKEADVQGICAFLTRTFIRLV